MDKCKPPSFPDAVFKGKRLDFTLTGADGQLKKVLENNPPLSVSLQALFTWAGYFLRRPYFVLRSPLLAEAPHGTAEVDPRVHFLWAEGPAGYAPTWFISAELGNKHQSQLFARWSMV